MDQSSGHGAVVVGFDGSEGGRQALRWALAEGQYASRRLHVVHSHEAVAGERAAEVAAVESRRLLDEALELCRDHPELMVTTEDLESRGNVTTASLLAASKGAEMVVVGCRGHRPPQGRLIGSVSEHLSRHARCPVVTVRPAQNARDERVVLGLIVEQPSDRALAFAFEHAASRRVGLTAINVWREHGGIAADGELAIEGRIAIAADEHMGALEAVLEPWRAKFPDISVTAESIGGHADKVLRDASENAALLVVGRRQRSGVGLLLGSISQSVLHHAHCPVAVVG